MSCLHYQRVLCLALDGPVPGLEVALTLAGLSSLGERAHDHAPDMEGVSMNYLTSTSPQPMAQDETSFDVFQMEAGDDSESDDYRDENDDGQEPPYVDDGSDMSKRIYAGRMMCTLAKESNRYEETSLLSLLRDGIGLSDCMARALLEEPVSPGSQVDEVPPRPSEDG